MNLIDIVLVVVALAFAWSMGAHYTGACMGMPYATGSISLRSALLDHGAPYAHRCRISKS